jgi:Tfp pilus assembly protein PilX
VIGRRWPGRDRGFFTAELAAGLPALMVLLILGLGAVSAVATKAQCQDTARDAALAVARGESAPRGANVEVGAETVTASVTASVPLLPKVTVRATATAAREPEVVR